MCYNGFELIGSELGLTADELFRCIQSRPKATSELIKNKGLSKIPLILGNDLILKGSEAAFISKGSDLWEHLENYFQRIHREAEFLSAPLIEPSNEVNVYLQEKIGEKLRALTDKLFISDKYGRIYEAFEKLEDMQRISREFSHLATRYLSNEQLIAGFIGALATTSGEDLVAESTQAAFIAMAVLHAYRGPGYDNPPVTQRRIVNLGMAVLFQDISHIIDNSEHDPGQPEHAGQSVLIAREMGLSTTCLEIIRNHHRVVDGDGNPILTSRNPSLEERIATVTNAFIQCVSEKHFNLDPDQAVYVLEHYANQAFYDKYCVRTLGTLGIGDRKYKILSKCFEFMKYCDKGGVPFVWNISADFPNRFICRNADCEHLGPEEVVLYQTIRFKGTLQDLVIPQGRYRKCGKLTRLLNQWMLKTFFPGQAGNHEQN
jgi:hypothetical protein